MNDWVLKLFFYWDYYWNIATYIYQMQDLNQFTTYAVKSSSGRADVSTCMELYGLKNWYTRKCVWPVSKKKRAREDPIE